MDKKAEITFGRFEDAIGDTDIADKSSSFAICQLGLAGEIGELLTELKKMRRGDVGDISHKQAVCQELGDCLWYLAQICKLWKSSLHQVAGQDKLISLDVLQQEDTSYCQGKDSVVDLATTLTIHNGKLAEALREKKDTQQILQDLLICIASIAKKLSLSLSEVASENIEKTQKRFGKDYSDLTFLDDGFPSFEQLPRKLKVEIRQEKVGETKKAMLFIKDFMYGNPLDDNITGEEDFFRYHDIFHMSFVAYLWWSPSFRALLNKKRRSNSRIDKNEDGGRARLLEEGLVHLIFRYGKDNCFFESKPEARVSSSILNAIEAMVKGYEVEDRPLSLWNEAIVRAFQIFIQVKQNEGGYITIDMKKRKLEYKKEKPVRPKQMG